MPIWKETRWVFQQKKQMEYVAAAKAGQAFMLQTNPEVVPVCRRQRYVRVKGGKLIITASETSIQKLWTTMEQWRAKAGMCTAQHLDLVNRVRNYFSKCCLHEKVMYEWIVQRRNPGISEDDLFQQYTASIAKAIAAHLNPEFVKPTPAPQPVVQKVVEEKSQVMRTQTQNAEKSGVISISREEYQRAVIAGQKEAEHDILKIQAEIARMQAGNSSKKGHTGGILNQFRKLSLR